MKFSWNKNQLIFHTIIIFCDGTYDTPQGNTKYTANKSQMMRRYKTLTNKVTSFLHLVCSLMLMEILVLTSTETLFLASLVLLARIFLPWWTTGHFSYQPQILGDKKCILLPLNITHSTML